MTPSTCLDFFSSIWHLNFPWNHIVFYLCIVSSNARWKRYHSGRSPCHRSGNIYNLFHILRVYCYWIPLGYYAHSTSGWEINWFPLTRVLWLQCFKGFTKSFFYVSNKHFEVHTIPIVQCSISNMEANASLPFSYIYNKFLILNFRKKN